MKVKDEHIRSITRTGRRSKTFYVTIPKRIVNEIGLKARQKVEVNYLDGVIVVSLYKK